MHVSLLALLALLVNYLFDRDHASRKVTNVTVRAELEVIISEAMYINLATLE